MATHLQFMKSIITLTMYTLKRDKEASNNGKKSSKLTDLIDVSIREITEESLRTLKGMKKIRRIFINSPDGGDYTGLGWIINDDIDNCMLCNAEFGYTTYKHHCKGCGSVVCHGCSPNKAIVFEISSVGELRVCHLCFFGQV